MILEICANSLQSAINAEKGGANRIELCINLEVGGLTPPSTLINEVQKALSIPVYVLIRPRAGDFVYSKEELEQMKDDISYCFDARCSGVVFGVLKKDNKIDGAATTTLLKTSKFMDVTFHRAFDLLEDHLEGLTMLKEMGVQRILTSGCNGTAPEGIEMLSELVDEAEDDVIIMPGGGIRPENILEIIKTGAQEFHSAAMSPDDHSVNVDIVKSLRKLIDKP